MVNLTFGEQVKIILSRKGMTIKQLAELVEQHTGKPMSRQNMTQRLGRDNFQEQDMRLIAEILGCKFQLSIMEMEMEDATDMATPVEEELHPLEREITIGELTDMSDDVLEPEVQEAEIEEPATVEVEAEEVVKEKDVAEETVSEVQKAASAESGITSGDEIKEPESKERELLRKGVSGYFKKSGNTETEKKEVVGDINPYTGKEYKTNSVRMHPKRIGYVQVYDQEQHKWTDMTEWAFLGYQERKKVLMGKDYEPPIYLD